MDSNWEQIRKLYEQLQNVCSENDELKRNDIIIMGDFNSQVRRRQKGEERMIELYQYG